MFSSLLCCWLLAAPGAQPPVPRLAVIRDAPDCTLLDQDGKKVKLSSFKGKVLLVSFIFTTCNGSCPATTHRMAKVHQLLKTANGCQPGVQFISITLDPERDTPEALRRYIQLFDLETESKTLTAQGTWFQWSFLTGPPSTVADTINAWGMWVKPTLNGQLDHPSRIFLVDQRLRIREIYNVDLLRPEAVVEDISELCRDK